MILRIADLEAWYGELQVLHGVTMHVNSGELVAIIGPNGSGKSTTLKSIAGLLQKKKGAIGFEDKKISRTRAHQITRLGISFVPQGRRVFPTMTVEENLEIGGFILSDKLVKERLAEVYSFLPDLKRFRNKKATFLSGGQQQLLSIGRALMLKPKVLLLDEPSLGLSPKAMKAIFRKIVEIKKKGTTVILVEQNAKAALEIADRAYVLELGRNKLTGEGKKLLNDKRVGKLYLGGK